LPSASASIKSKVDPKDIMSLAEYEKVRKGLVQAHRTPLKKLRRVALGPRYVPPARELRASRCRIASLDM